MNRKLFEERLKKLRGEKTQKQVTDEMNIKNPSSITQQTLARYENGDRLPNAETLCDIAEYYNVSVDYLLGRTENPSIDEDIINACKVTGLSEEAIKKITQFKEFNLSTNDRKKLEVNGTEIINSLIPDKWFGAFIQRLAIYHIRTRSVVQKVIENKSINLNIDEIEYERTLAKLALFEVSQASTLIAENFKSPHFEEAARIIDKLKNEFEKEAANNAKHNPTSE